MNEEKSCIRGQANPLQINRCRNSLAKGEESFSQLSAVLSLAGNDIRLKILYLLKQETELCPCDLSDILGVSIPAISQHLRKMKDGNIVQTRKEKQTIFYSLKPEHLKLLLPLFSVLDKLNQNLVSVT